MNCTCHQASGDSWDCPEHYSLNRRFKEASRLLEIATGKHHSDAGVRLMLKQIDKENSQRDKAFWKEAFAELDRRGL